MNAVTVSYSSSLIEIYCSQPETFYLRSVTHFGHIPFRIEKKKQQRMMQLTEGRKELTVIYIHTERTGRTQTSIFESNYCS
jgi:hypothetical protein